MTDERRSQEPREGNPPASDLEFKIETIADLTEEQSERAKGGAFLDVQAACGVCSQTHHCIVP